MSPDLQEEPGIEWRGRCPQVAQELHASLDDIRQWSDRVCIADAVIRWIRLDQAREASTGLPIELPAIDDHAADRCAMPTNKLGRRVKHDIRAMLEWLDEIRRRERVIDDERQTILVSNRGHGLDIQRVQAWIAQRLGIEGFGFVVDGRAKILRIAAVHKMRGDA